MAVDEAILESVGRGEVPPTLRLYAWAPPCLSIGYAQPISEVDLAQLSTLRWDIVRRLTGGRAILHTDELTYAVITPPHEPRLAGGVLEGYRRLAQAFLTALQRLEIPAEIHAKTQNTPSSGQQPVCFEVPSNYEITVDGKKIIGSAQSRKLIGILQHGTFPLSGDLTRINQTLVFPNEASRKSADQRVLARATTAESILGRPLSWDQAAQAFSAAIAAVLNLKLAPSQLTPAEEERAAELVRKKYGNFGWTGRK
jgi:lipoate-protein ligase A